MIEHNPFLTGLARYFTAEQVNRLGSVCVGIAGAGGLGSNCAVHLVRSGVRHLVVVDFDTVASSNLNRQFYFVDQVGMKKIAALEENLRRIQPVLEMQGEDIRIDSENAVQVFAGCDIIVEALDGAQDKKMMADLFAADPRLLVCASGIGGWGENNRIRTRRFREDFFLVGDEQSEVSETMPPTSAVVGIAAAKQADIVITNILEGRVRGFKESRVQGD